MICYPLTSKPVAVSGAQEQNAYENRLAAHLQDMICDVSEWRSMVEVHLISPKC